MCASVAESSLDAQQLVKASAWYDIRYRAFAVLVSNINTLIHYDYYDYNNNVHYTLFIWLVIVNINIVIIIYSNINILNINILFL